MKSRVFLEFTLLCALASPAAALPVVPLYFDGPSNFGTKASDAAAAATNPLGPTFPFLDLDTTSLNFSNAGGAGLPNPTCKAAPMDSTCLDLTVVIPPTVNPILGMPPSKTDPTTVTSGWQVTNTSGNDLETAYLVFVSSVGALSGDASLVGLDALGADDYTIITFLSGIGQINYAAIDLGMMLDGETRMVNVNYVVADNLIPAGGMNFLLPILNTQALAAVPEPGAASLMALGLLGLAATRRRSCA